MSNFGKILIFITILLILIIFFNSFQTKKEGFVQQDKFLFKNDNSLYDDFYSNIYDYLVYNNLKNEYEVGTIVNNTKPNDKSVILDIGCGTGHHVGALASKGLNVLGIDMSPSMIKKAKENYPEYDFQVGDALNGNLVNYSSITHILCLYFTIYYFKDKRRFFDNCMDWLMPGGYLIVHIVDRDHFDPILPPGNPLYIVSPQKYAKERITKTKVTFTDFDYESKFDLDKNNDLAVFNEKFKFKNGNIRKHEQKLHMEDVPVIINIAQECGFLLQAKIDLVKCAYENQYLYVFIKPV